MHKDFVIVTWVTWYCWAHLCKRLMLAGFWVVGTYRSEEQLSHLKAFLAENWLDSDDDSKCIFIQLDLAEIEEERFEDFFQKIENLYVCHLINNAALDNQDVISEVRLEKMKRLFEVNVFSPILLSRFFCEMLSRKERTGCVINISSLLAEFGDKQSSLYGASKAALEWFWRNASVELSKKGIRFLNVELCNLPNSLVGEGSDGLRRQYQSNEMNKGDSIHYDSKNCPLGYPKSYEQFVNPIVSLLDNASSYITGTTIHIDGGVSVRR